MNKEVKEINVYTNKKIHNLRNKHTNKVNKLMSKRISKKIKNKKKIKKINNNNNK